MKRTAEALLVLDGVGWLVVDWLVVGGRWKLLKVLEPLC